LSNVLVVEFLEVVALLLHARNLPLEIGSIGQKEWPQKRRNKIEQELDVHDGGPMKAKT
jgi:hypothetical protein